MEFIKGFDVSTLLEVERRGGVFRDGGEAEDALTILKRYGGSWIRLRLWNDPYDGSGGDYGAGICDLATVLTLARRAKNLGMDWLLDLHYSDFWADPGKQRVPKAWKALNESELEKAVYQYTKDVLCACRAAGTPPGMVQVGNEVTNGLLWPTGQAANRETMYRYIMSGVRAVREELPRSRVMIHLDNGGRNDLYRAWFDQYFQYGGECDVIGLSYYPFWQGALQGLAANMSDLAVRYGKDLVIAETSMAFTLEDYAEKERLGDCPRKGAAATAELCAGVPYPITPQGQAEYTADLLRVLRNVPEGHGKGLFWWEAAWIPVPGVGWARQSGWEYAREKGPGGNEWANQALFDYDGNVLPALAVIRDRQQ